MNCIQRILIVGLFLTGCASVAAQQFGAFPPGTRWRQISTDTARIIYTPGSAEVAQKIAGYIHKAAADTPFSLGNKMRKINVVLHNKTTIANGYVGLAPFRSEYYLVPSSDLFSFGNLPWYENLAVHEYRHVQQYSNFRNGVSKVFYYLFGEAGQDLANSAAVPNWFFEGDAVHSETALTTQGRGRLPLFLSAYRSLWLANKRYSWMTLRNGSLRRYVPDHYALGYLLVNYGFMKYGPSFWEHVTHDATAFRGVVYPFEQAVKRYSGVHFKKFREEALAFYQRPLAELADTALPKKGTVTNYYFAQYIGEDSMLFLRSSYKRIAAFYLKDKRGVHKIRTQDISSENWISYRNGTLAYTAFSTDPRWSLVNYSDVVLLDLNGRHQKRITHHARYYTPDLSPSGRHIVAVRVDDSLHTSLEVLNAASGGVLTRWSGGSEYYYSNPRYVDEQTVVLGIRTEDARMSLSLLNTVTGKFTPLTPASANTFGLPFVSGDSVYFTSNMDGNDDLFVCLLQTKRVFQLTHDLTGDYYVSVRGNAVVFSHFTAGGLTMRQLHLKDLLWKEVTSDAMAEKILPYPVALPAPLVPQDRSFLTRPYGAGTGLLHFHSWIPNYQPPEFTLSLYSENILNTLQGQIYYRFNQDESSHTAGATVSYGQLFPVLQAGAEYTLNRSIITPTRTFHYNEVQMQGGFYIPLDLSKGKFYRALNFGSSVVFDQSFPTANYTDSLRYRRDVYLYHSINFSQYLPEAVQHIYPRFGYSFSGALRHLVSNSGHQLLANAQLFLPALFNHSIVFTGNIQETDTGNVVFSNRFVNSRGYDDYYFSRMWHVGGNYHVPLAYPDWGFGNIVYVLRLRGNLFFDYTRVYSKDKSQSRNLRSTGGEVYFDSKWWNELPVSFGFRVSHLLDNDFTAQKKAGTNWFEFIVPVNLINY